MPIRATGSFSKSNVMDNKVSASRIGSKTTLTRESDVDS